MVDTFDRLKCVLADRYAMYEIQPYGVGVLVLLGIAAPAVMGTGVKEAERAPRLASVSGRVTIRESENVLAGDVAQAVVWLETRDDVPVAPDRVDVMTSDREFRPRVLVVPVGTTVSFPNSDPFVHNVFSRSAARPFDLGDYGRGESRSIVLPRPGVMLVLCNVHAQMSAIVVVRDNPYYAQPTSDGSFLIAGVPPGDYLLRAWHERAEAFTPQPVRVEASGIGDLTIELDAQIHTFVQQLNEHGQPYSRVRKGRRY